jgi:hypothetical protein
VRVVDDLTGRTLRELLTLARERLGPTASGLKTREELVAALTPSGGPVASVEPAVPVVTRDFFKRRNE